jgi:hypothetical protein
LVYVTIVPQLYHTQRKNNRHTYASFLSHFVVHSTPLVPVEITPHITARLSFAELKTVIHTSCARESRCVRKCHRFHWFCAVPDDTDYPEVPQKVSVITIFLHVNIINPHACIILGGLHKPCLSSSD